MAGRGRSRRGSGPATALLLAAVLVLTTAPLVMRSGSDFSGTDGAALGVIAEVSPKARPWIEPLWTPPGSEVQSFLFALQAALGGGVVGYYFGLKRGRAGRQDAPEGEPHQRQP